MKNKRPMTCCCCGNYAGKWQQWWNRDTGFGICSRCIDWMKGRGTPEEEMKGMYGVENIHWGFEP